MQTRRQPDTSHPNVSVVYGPSAKSLRVWNFATCSYIACGGKKCAWVCGLVSSESLLNGCWCLFLWNYLKTIDIFDLTALRGFLGAQGINLNFLGSK